MKHIKQVYYIEWFFNNPMNLVGTVVADNEEEAKKLILDNFEGAPNLEIKLVRPATPEEVSLHIPEDEDVPVNATVN